MHFALDMLQATQQSVRQAVQERQGAVRAILELAAVRDLNRDCRYDVQLDCDDIHKLDSHAGF